MKQIKIIKDKTINQPTNAIKPTNKQIVESLSKFEHIKII